LKRRDHEKGKVTYYIGHGSLDLVHPKKSLKIIECQNVELSITRAIFQMCMSRPENAEKKYDISAQQDDAFLASWYI
jgi:hypothetical protein